MVLDDHKLWMQKSEQRLRKIKIVTVQIDAENISIGGRDINDSLLRELRLWILKQKSQAFLSGSCLGLGLDQGIRRRSMRRAIRRRAARACCFRGCRQPLTLQEDTTFQSEPLDDFKRDAMLVTL